ncbi:MAG: cysteine desulfurase family protein [Acidimicrobiales bacterium]
MTRHYLDHASTSRLRPEAAAAIADWLSGPAGDPGRIHHEGMRVRGAVESAREQVADLLGVRPREVVFTSGATEACNAAVWGAARAVPGGPVLCAPVEHSAVRQASERLAPVVDLPVDGLGRVVAGGFAEVLDAALAAADRGEAPRPALVHCQWANHEVGTVQPVAEVVARCREAAVPVHVDAAAAAGHLGIGLGTLGADLVSVSAHKLGGPPGTGALVVRRGVRFDPLLSGGAQERGRRAGMENVPGIVGFGAAAAALAASHHEEAGAARRRTDRLVAEALAVEGVVQVGDPAERVPHLVCLAVDGVEAEPVLLGLDQAGVAAHSGSACSSESLEPSPVLAAMGVDADRSLRLSVGWSTTDADVDAFARAFPRVVAVLRALGVAG